MKNTNENKQMVLSQTKEIKHHADELAKVLGKHKNIESWVVGKIERASTDLSDVTHYLDGKNEYKNGGKIDFDSIDEEIRSLKARIKALKENNNNKSNEEANKLAKQLAYLQKKYYNIHESNISKMAKGGEVESEINELYKKSKFINDDFNWKLKLLEMLQDNSIDAYNIYQTLSKQQKEDVLQEQFELDNDMGSDGDGDIETTKENLNILLQDAKNGKKYSNGGELGGFCYSIGGL
jgi:hypothetical protein